ncbi:MAG: ABC transporter permease subunit [Fimbriimonas sp.]|nr:ABC transporter permease subunit [Fimbriimonas sp.]
MASPIADLTYRNYDGPLEPPVNRWWAIAKMSMRLSTKKRGFWVWSTFSCFWYGILLIIFYVNDTLAAANPMGQQVSLLKGLVWKDQFLNAFSESQLFLFILALLTGAGSIANDNRAKALLVYLSKPCTKLDYVIGKWLGIFIPITLVTTVPAVVFYLYCLMSYRSYGFWSQDPWLFVQLMGMVLIPGTLYASITLAISSLFEQGRLAGAVFAGVYFISYFVTLLMELVHTQMTMGGNEVPPIVNNLFYASIDGLQIGMLKIILHTNGSPKFPIQLGQMSTRMQVPEPSTFLFIPLFLVICAGSVLLAWSQIRAVEVVR